MGVCETKNKDDNEARSANVLLSCGFVIFSSLYHFPPAPGSNICISFMCTYTFLRYIDAPKLLCDTVRHF